MQPYLHYAIKFVTYIHYTYKYTFWFSENSLSFIAIKMMPWAMSRVSYVFQPIFYLCAGRQRHSAMGKKTPKRKIGF